MSDKKTKKEIEKEKAQARWDEYCRLTFRQKLDFALGRQRVQKLKEK